MILLTGGAGFIGSAVLRHLNDHGRRDIVVVDHLASSSKWRNLVGKSFEDYLDRDELLKYILSDALPFKIRSIVHLGACSSTLESDAGYLLRNNTKYTQHLCEYAIKHGIRFVYASSAATYGEGLAGYADDETKLDALRPLNAYGFSKHLFDVWAHQRNLFKNIVGLKFFNVFGPNEYHKGEMRSVLHKAYAQVRESGTIRLYKSYRKEYPDGGQKRDFIYVKDCADVVMWFLDNPSAHGLFNLGSGQARSWNDLAGALFSALKVQPRIEYIDMPDQLRSQYQYFTEAPMQKLRAAGYTKPFTSIEGAVADYVQAHLSNPWQHY